MRRLSGKRKYSQTAWLITSAGNRYPERLLLNGRALSFEAVQQRG